MKERTLVFVIWVFRLKIVSSVPMSSISTTWHLATKDVIDVITSVDEFNAALFILDFEDDDFEPEIVLAFDFTALSLFLAKYKEDNIDLRFDELVLHFET